MIIPVLLALLAVQAPDPTLPTGAQTLVSVEGRGVQIYHCTQNTWIFDAPEATLTGPNSRQPLGTHGAGPTWNWNDGSSLSGKILQKIPAPDPASLPWLLLETRPAGTVTGTLTPVIFVRRSDTHGGMAPTTSCDAQHQGTVARVPYSATYTFYTPAP